MSHEPTSTAIPIKDESTVLAIDSLSVTFATPDGCVQAVRNVTLRVGPGECLGIVGESGAGKSQLFLAVMGLLAANASVTGRVQLEGNDLLSLRPAQWNRVRGARIGMIFQDPMTSLTPHIRIGDQIAEPLVRHNRMAWREARTRALELLKRVHVTDAEQRMRQYPHELSGGMRQRVVIASAIGCNPSLLIADEPTTSLDVTMQAQILALLAELKRTRRMSMVLITHDLGAVAGVADRVAVMKGGQIIESGSVSTVLKTPSHPYTRSLLAAVPRIDSDRASDDTDRASGDSAFAQLGEPTARIGEPATRIEEHPLRLHDLSVDFAVRTRALLSQQWLHAVTSVSLDIRAGEALGIVGESGSGKSTLARAALRLIPSRAGGVVWLGRPVEELAASELRPLRRNIQIIFQDPLASLDPRMTVGGIVEEALRLHRPGLDGGARRREVQASLVRVGLGSELLNRYPHQLSGGQCQRVGIARAIVLQPRVLVCDEPVSALDVTVQEQIMELLAELKRDFGLAILFISHNLAVVQSLCERVLVLYLGRMMEMAPVGRLYAKPLHPYTRQLLDSAPLPDPAVQPSRLGLALSGEAPSPLAPPSGCVYRTRCPHAVEICSAQIPVWEEGDAATHRVACHRWRELA